MDFINASSLLKIYLQLVLNPIAIAVLVVILPVLIFVVVNHNYKKSTYYQICKTPYLRVRFDLGLYGEYLTYKYLNSFEKSGARFLFNLYIPKQDGNTTEIDIIMICSKGIFVFESKNYSGWIFGNDTQLKWYQTLPNGKGKSTKESFYNPVFQNDLHKNHLLALLGDNIPTYSIVTFSERCTLKSVHIGRNDVKVIKRDKVYDTVSEIYSNSNDILSISKINELTDRLYPYTQINAKIKEEHINNLSKFKNENSLPDLSSNAINENVDSKCPKCGAPLILRVAKKGTNIGKQFYGCSNFPRCKFTKSE